MEDFLVWFPLCYCRLFVVKVFKLTLCRFPVFVTNGASLV